MANGTVAERPLKVFYDGACGFCGRSRRFFTPFDWFGATEWVDHTRPETAARFPQTGALKEAKALQVLDIRNGRIEAGFDAVRRLGLATPLFWPLAVLGYLPGVPWVGRKVYRFIADNRHGLACPRPE